MAKQKDGRWNNRILQCRPWTEKINRVTLITRWYDNIKKVEGVNGSM